MRCLWILVAITAFVVIGTIVSPPVSETLQEFRYLVAALFLLAILVAAISAGTRRWV